MRTLTSRMLWGSMDQGTKAFTLKQVDDPQYGLVAGMKVSEPGAGARAPLTATIVSPVPPRPFKVGDVINLDTAAITSVTKQPLGWFKGDVAFPIAAGSHQSLCVPNKGAPSGNFKFYMGCPTFRADSDPFNGAGCVIGAAAGDAAGLDTLFESTFGCMPPLSGKDCAFNPGDSAAACPGPSLPQQAGRRHLSQGTTARAQRASRRWPLPERVGRRAGYGGSRPDPRGDAVGPWPLTPCDS